MGIVFWLLFQFEKFSLKRQGWVLQRDASIPVNFFEANYILRNHKKFAAGEIRFTIRAGADAWKSAIVYGLIPTSTILKGLSALREKYKHD